MKCRYKGEWAECTYVNTEYSGWSKKKIITVCIEGEIIKFLERKYFV